MAALEARLARGDDASRRLFDNLVYGWGNEGMSAQPEYLAEVITQARATPGAILECGAGLTTLILGLIARRRAGRVISLEENGLYAQDVRSRLARYSIAHAEIVLRPAHRLWGVYLVSGAYRPVGSILTRDLRWPEPCVSERSLWSPAAHAWTMCSGLCHPS